MTELMNIETWCALTYIPRDPPRSKCALMEPRLNDYYAPIGKLTIAAARGRKLKDQRNENIHAVWAEMVHADTGEFAQFTRSRYDKDKATHTTKWDVGVPPSIEELEKLADDLRTLAHELNNHLANLWATDEDVYHWRDQHRF